MTKSIITEMNSKMKSTIEFLKNELFSIRAGRANPHILDKVMVNFYGVETPIAQTANISTPEARMIQVKPFDVSQIGEIEKAILAANLGLNPTNDGKVLRITIPMLTGERRKQIVKDVKKLGEDAKIAIRNERRVANDALKTLNKDSELSDDELKREEKSVQDSTDKFIAEIDTICKAKEEEVLEI